MKNAKIQKSRFTKFIMKFGITELQKYRNSYQNIELQKCEFALSKELLNYKNMEKPPNEVNKILVWKFT